MPGREPAPASKTQQHVARPGAQAACRGRGHTVLGTVPGRRPDSAPFPPAGPSLLFILPGTQRLQEQHVIDNEPSVGQGLAIGSACKSRGWRAGAALQNKSLCYSYHQQTQKALARGPRTYIGSPRRLKNHPVLGGKVI